MIRKKDLYCNTLILYDPGGWGAPQWQSWCATPTNWLNCDSISTTFTVVVVRMRRCLQCIKTLEPFAQVSRGDHMLLPIRMDRIYHLHLLKQMWPIGASSCNWNWDCNASGKLPIVRKHEECSLSNGVLKMEKEKKKKNNQYKLSI